MGPGARFVIGSLATWRLTHLLVEEDGPGHAVVRLRMRAGAGALGDLMDCFYCLSVWVAAPFGVALAPRARQAPLVALAISGAACLLEQATRERDPVTPVTQEAPAEGDRPGPRRPT
jgi:hypothetical protein